MIQHQIDMQNEGIQLKDRSDDLLEKAGQLGAVLNSIADGLVIYDSSGAIIRANRVAEEILGFSAESADKNLAQRIRELNIRTPAGNAFAPEDTPAMRALNKGETVRSVEMVLTNPAGRTYWLSASAAPIVYEDGSRHGAIATFVDITQLHETKSYLENTLSQSKENETRYRQLLETASSIILRFDECGVIRFINNFGAAFFGYTKEELVGETLLKLMPPAEPSAAHDVRELAKNIMEHPERHASVPNQNVKKSGEAVWITWTNKALVDEHGRLQEILAIGIDITDLKKAQDQIEHWRQWLERIAETTPDIIFVLDLGRNRLVYSNKSLSGVLGYSSEEFKNLEAALELVIGKADIQRVRTFYKDMRTARPSEVRVLAHRTRRKDGAISWIESRVTPFLWEKDGKVKQVIGIAHDITDLKQAEESLRESERRLKILNENLESLVVQRTEQIRNFPKALALAEQRERRRFSQQIHENLQQILLGAKMQLDEHLLDHRKAGTTLEKDEILQSIALLNQAIQLTRSLSLELNPPLLKTQGLDASLAWLSKHMKKTYGLTVSLRTDDSIKTIKDEMQFMLLQMVRELLNNVVRHSGVLEAQVEVWCRDNYVKIKVSDKGGGFNVNEVRERMGTGTILGLFNIQEKLKLFSGNLSMDASPGHGTRILVAVPLETC